MPRLVLPQYTVVRDTRDKDGHGWTFDRSHSAKRPPLCAGMVEATLGTGDYSMLGYEDIFTIERKQDFGELWGNYGERKRFESEMERMLSIKHRFIVIESTITPDTFNLSPPQYTRGVPGKALTGWLAGLMVEYHVPILFAGQCGKRISQQIMESVVRLEKDRWVPATSKEEAEPVL